MVCLSVKVIYFHLKTANGKTAMLSLISDVVVEK